MQAHGHVGAETHGRRLVLVHGGVLQADQAIQALERQRL
jgi:hypothetical protein